MDFAKIAPYLRDPLVLVGFFLLLAFLFARSLLRHGVIPRLPPGPGFRILRILLLYGFIIGLLLILLGFGIKYKQIRTQQRKDEAEQALRRGELEQQERDLKERVNRAAALAAQKEAEQLHIVALLKGELETNRATVNELRQNAATILSIESSLMAGSRTAGIRVLPVIFPRANIEPPYASSPSGLADEAMDSLGRQGLDKDAEEQQKFAAFAKAVSGTIDRTIATVRSLADSGGSRYVIRDDIWSAHLPVLREVSSVDVTLFQSAYAAAQRLRVNYEVLVARAIDYLEALRAFLDPTDRVIDRVRLAKVLAAERLAIQIATAYGEQLADNTSQFKVLSDRLSVAENQLPSHHPLPTR